VILQLKLLRLDGSPRTLARTCAAVARAVAERPRFDLPRPTGPAPVGTLSFTLERPPEPRGISAGRFGVRVWYPGQASTRRGPYGSGRPGIRRWIYHRLVTTNAAENVAFATVSERAPVIVYVAGWGGERTDNTALAEELASHGFVVAAIGDIRFEGPPASCLAGPPDLRSAVAYKTTLRLARDKVAFDVLRVSAVLDRLAGLDAADPSGHFTGKLDLARAGVIGYSFGGAVALEACRRDPRLRAAVNMDGWLFDSASGYRGGIPYFLIADRAPLPGPDDLTAADPAHRYASALTVADDECQREVLRLGGYELRIDGANHLSFADVPLYAVRHRYGSRRSDASLISRAVRDHTVAFFEHVFTGKPSPLLEPGTRRQPQMTLTRWPSSGARGGA
jgi:dienelactone hydrolase